MLNSTVLLQSKTLRKNLRDQRKKISAFQQKITAYQIKNAIARHPQFKKSINIGLYLDAFGEVQTQSIIEYCFTQGKQVFLPMICNMNQKLVWVRVSQHQYRTRKFSKHRLGMLEPMSSRGLAASKLDLILIPLLACDQSGTRMGMGGGFYDRTLATASQQPYRLGLAHDFQVLLKPLMRNPWDQTLDGLITPSRIFKFKRSSGFIKNSI